MDPTDDMNQLVNCGAPEDAADNIEPAPPEHTPRRGDDVEHWIKRYRDAYGQIGASDVWVVIDDLLDEYRLHCDTGTPLHQEVSER